MRSIGIVGAGQSGLQLGIGLLKHGYEVKLLSNLGADQMSTGRVSSSQCIFNSARCHERDLGVAFWDGIAPEVEGIEFAAVGQDGGKALSFLGLLDAPAQSVDHRVKMPRWMKEFARLGGQLRIVEAGIPELEALAKSCELVLVAAGKGDVARLFDRDARRSPFDRPLRALALTYVAGVRPREGHSAVSFNLIPGVGEYFIVPALTTTGPCEIMIFEAVPGGPMDVWQALSSPEQHLAASLAVLRTYLPWEYERARGCTLTDAHGVLAGRFAPIVRHPIATLPSGAKVLGMADAVCLNDPLTGQGSNNASKAAATYLAAILERERQPFSASWMTETFDRFWAYARFVVDWTNGMLLPPPPHVQRLLAEGQTNMEIRRWFANAFDDPRRFFPMFADPSAADHFLATMSRQT